MTASTIAQLLQAAPTAALPGTWKLARGRAITLQPANHGVLRVAHGRLWVTFDGPHGVRPDDSGDLVLEVGRSLPLRAGQRVVMEPWNRSGATFFSWDPVAAPLPQAVRAPRVNLAGVLQPLADLRAAAALGGLALGRLAVGVARLGFDALRPRAPASAPLPRVRVRAGAPV